jgi:hypothetical protein
MFSDTFVNEDEMINVMGVLEETLPVVPETISVYAPGGAECATLKVSIEDPEASRELGWKLASTPVGRPERERATVPANPFCSPTTIPSVLPAPRSTVRPLGEAERLKPMEGSIVTVTDALL